MKSKHPKGFGEKPKKNPAKNIEIAVDQMQTWTMKARNGDVSARLKAKNAQANFWNEYSQIEGSTAIHERDYKPMKCCLCGADMPSIHDTHNPAPLTRITYAKEALEKNLPYRCCAKCDREKVIPARIYNVIRKKEEN